MSEDTRRLDGCPSHPSIFYSGERTYHANPTITYTMGIVGIQPGFKLTARISPDGQIWVAILNPPAGSAK